MIKYLCSCGLLIVLVAADAPASEAVESGPTFLAQAPSATHVTRVTAFDRYVIEGGWVTLAFLLPISFIAMALVFQNSLRTRQEMMGSSAVLEQVCDWMQRGDYGSAIQACTTDHSAVGHILRSGFQCAPDGLVVMRRAMEQALDERAIHLLRRLEYLNLIGHVAPMVGLFGTVHGIIAMFGSIADAGGIPVMSSISHDLGAALIATFWGLLIAIPSLVAFNVLRGKVDILLQQCSMSIDKVMLTLKRRPTAPAHSTKPQTP